MTDRRSHWDAVYRTRRPESVSWFQPSLRLSLEMIRRTGLGRDAALIDIGGGASTLIDDLLSIEYNDVTILDISSEALLIAKARLGERARSVNWIEGDITTVSLPPLRFDLWHDRAVFHFLSAESERGAYSDAMKGAVRPGGFAVIATFGPNGPLKCSGLDTARYSPDSLGRMFGDAFALTASEVEIHTTPSGARQEFVYCLFQKLA